MRRCSTYLESGFAHPQPFWYMVNPLVSHCEARTSKQETSRCRHNRQKGALFSQKPPFNGSTPLREPSWVTHCSRTYGWLVFFQTGLKNGSRRSFGFPLNPRNRAALKTRQIFVTPLFFDIRLRPSPSPSACGAGIARQSFRKTCRTHLESTSAIPRT